MKQAAVIGAILIIVLGAAAAMFITRKRDTDNSETSPIPSKPCFSVDHEKWGYWNEQERPDGVFHRLAKKYFSGKSEDELNNIAFAIGGWFKGVDAYPRKTWPKYTRKILLLT